MKHLFSSLWILNEETKLIIQANPSSTFWMVQTHSALQHALLWFYVDGTSWRQRKGEWSLVSWAYRDQSNKNRASMPVSAGLRISASGLSVPGLWAPGHPAMRISLIQWMEDTIRAALANQSQFCKMDLASQRHHTMSFNKYFLASSIYNINYPIAFTYIQMNYSKRRKV